MRSLSLAVVLGVVLAACGSPSSSTPAHAPAQAPAAADPLPDQALFALPGPGVVHTADYHGRPLVLNFWATWCAPCRREMPAFQQVWRELGGDVAFLGVNLEDDQGDALDLVAETGVTYDLAADPAGLLWREIGGIGMPTTLFVDADGLIVRRHTGQLSAEALRELIRTELRVTG